MAETPSLPETLAATRAAAPTAEPGPMQIGLAPFLSLATGWDNHAADLRGRAGNLMARAAALRAGTVEASGLAQSDPASLERSARRNVISSTVLENCARDLRSHLSLVTRDGLDRLLAAIESAAYEDDNPAF